MNFVKASGAIAFALFAMSLAAPSDRTMGWDMGSNGTLGSNGTWFGGFINSTWGDIPMRASTNGTWGNGTWGSTNGTWGNGTWGWDMGSNGTWNMGGTNGTWDWGMGSNGTWGMFA